MEVSDMTRHWLGKPALAIATVLLAAAAAWPMGASAHGWHDRGWHGRGHYDRGYYGGGWHGHAYRERGHWSGGRWIAGAIVTGAVIGLVDDALNPPPRTVVYERPVYRRPVRVIYEEPVVTRRVVETRTVYEEAPPTRYVGYYGDDD
jgi:hypothetical protein